MLTTYRRDEILINLYTDEGKEGPWKVNGETVQDFMPWAATHPGVGTPNIWAAVTTVYTAFKWKRMGMEYEKAFICHNEDYEECM